ncbi:uncharacterized protein LOC109806962 [Cajanus cajan]|nr:uncharacterized protein LOC109798615 [Cajanus cajan]XP_020225081.1 uncharacterized protein LOC109806962 [Cajanus cajan]
MPTPEDELYDAWERCNVMVISWITRSVSAQIAQSTIYIDNAQELWQDLKDRFSKGDYFRTFDLLQEIHSIRQGDRNISSFFTDLKILWEELESLRPIPSCLCQVKCLNDQFATIKAQVLLMEPLPTINKVFSLILQQERQLTGTTAIDSNVLMNISSSNRPMTGSPSNANQNFKSAQSRGTFSNNRGSNMRGRGNSRGGSVKPKICTFCCRERHTEDTCYFKHDFPPDFVFNKPRNVNAKVNSAVTNDVEEVNDCAEENEEVNANSNSDPTQAPSYSFSPEQYAQITALLNKLNTNQEHHSANQIHGETQMHKNSGTLSWILDTGATDHVCQSLTYFDAFTAIRPIQIKLPNGSVVLAKF